VFGSIRKSTAIVLRGHGGRFGSNQEVEEKSEQSPELACYQNGYYDSPRRHGWGWFAEGLLGSP
jgi:hypothetical protein